MTILSQQQIATLTSLRHELHRRPELSGEEAATANRMAKELTALGADRIWRGLGGAWSCCRVHESERRPHGAIEV